MTTPVICLVLLVPTVVPSADVFPARAQNVGEVVPSGWKVLGQSRGDIDRDGENDFVVVIQGTDPRMIEDQNPTEVGPVDHNPRALGIFFQRDGYWEKQHESPTFIPLRESSFMDEPFRGVRIRRLGVIQLDLHFGVVAGSWKTSGHSYKFRYQKGRFELIGYDKSELHRATGETTQMSINFSTRRMKVTRGNISSDAPSRETWTRFKLSSLHSLESLRTVSNWEFESISNE